MAEEPKPSEAPGASLAPSPGVSPSRRPSRVMLLVACGCVFVLIVAVGIKWSGERRAAVECRGALEQLWSAARKEAEANGGKLPSGGRALEDLVLRHLRHGRYWNCPQTGSRYLWTSRERLLGDNPRWLLAWETQPHGWPMARHRALFVDGRIEDLSGGELRALLARERREPPSNPATVLFKPDLGEDPAAPPPGWRLPRKSDPPKTPATQEPGKQTNPVAPGSAPGTGG